MGSEWEANGRWMGGGENKKQSGFEIDPFLVINVTSVGSLQKSCFLPDPARENVSYLIWHVF